MENIDWLHEIETDQITKIIENTLKGNKYNYNYYNCEAEIFKRLVKHLDLNILSQSYVIPEEYICEYNISNIINQKVSETILETLPETIVMNYINHVPVSNKLLDKLIEKYKLLEPSDKSSVL